MYKEKPLKQEKMTYRKAIRLGISEKMREDDRVFVLGEDVGIFGGSFGVTKGLLEEFGNSRIRDTPISEGGIMGAAVGAAMVGMRPIVEIMFSDFITLTMDQLVNTAAKVHYMYGEQMSVPLVLRTAAGSGTGAAAQHSQSLEAWVCHIPGIKVVAPSTPYDAKGLLRAAIEDGGPVVFFEQKGLYDTVGMVPTESYSIPLGKAEVKRQGTDLSIVTYGRMVELSLEAAAIAKEKWGIEVEVLDLRTLAPLDTQAIKDTVSKTGRLLVVHEACQTGGLGGEIIAQITESTVFHQLKAPVGRVCGADVPIPFAKGLEEAAVPTVARIVERVGLGMGKV